MQHGPGHTADMMALHQRMMADPVIRARVQADTAMRRMLDGMAGDMPADHREMHRQMIESGSRVTTDGAAPRARSTPRPAARRAEPAPARRATPAPRPAARPAAPKPAADPHAGHGAPAAKRPAAPAANPPADAHTGHTGHRP
jgi:hypothetical protein